MVHGTDQPPGADWMVAVKNKPPIPFGILGQKVKGMKIVNIEIYRDLTIWDLKKRHEELRMRDSNLIRLISRGVYKLICIFILIIKKTLIIKFIVIFFSFNLDSLLPFMHGIRFCLCSIFEAFRCRFWFFNLKYIYSLDFHVSELIIFKLFLMQSFLLLFKPWIMM